MPFLALHVVFSFLLDLAHVLTRGDRAKDVELLLLRQQLRVYERQAKQPRLSRSEKVALASLATRLSDLSRVALIFTPATLLRWHQELVKRKWTFDNRPRRGRPPVSAARVELLLRLARENPGWGYGKLQCVYGLGTSSPPAVYAHRGLLLADNAPARNAAGESRCS
jgi:putative transposase